VCAFRCESEDGGLPFAVDADRLEGRSIQPETIALGTAPQGGLADLKSLEAGLASRARTGIIRELDVKWGRDRSAMVAKLAADEHQPKTFGARHGLEPAPAELAY